MVDAILFVFVFIAFDAGFHAIVGEFFDFLVLHGSLY